MPKTLLKRSEKFIASIGLIGVCAHMLFVTTETINRFMITLKNAQNPCSVDLRSCTENVSGSHYFLKPLLLFNTPLLDSIHAPCTKTMKETPVLSVNLLCCVKLVYCNQISLLKCRHCLAG